MRRKISLKPITLLLLLITFISYGKEQEGHGEPKTDRKTEIKEYILKNAAECRSIRKTDGTFFEPCEIKDYLYNNASECRTIKKSDGTSFEPCYEKEYTYSR